MIPECGNLAELARFKLVVGAKQLRKALEKYSPEKALSVVNEDLYSNDQEQIPLKVFLAVLNLRSGVLMTFNTGHVDPVIRSANGNVKFIKGPFLPQLGATEDATFTALPLQLNNGDKLCFYSNGVLEVANGHAETYGTERLLKIISSSGNDASGIIRAICADVKNFTGETALCEDIAIAVLEYTPEGLR